MAACWLSTGHPAHFGTGYPQCCMVPLAMEFGAIARQSVACGCGLWLPGGVVVCCGVGCGALGIHFVEALQVPVHHRRLVSSVAVLWTEIEAVSSLVLSLSRGSCRLFAIEKDDT